MIQFLCHHAETQIYFISLRKSSRLSVTENPSSIPHSIFYLYIYSRMLIRIFYNVTKKINPILVSKYNKKNAYLIDFVTLFIINEYLSIYVMLQL